MASKMKTYEVDVNAKYSESFRIKAKNVAEAKEKAFKRFCKKKNFEFYVEKLDEMFL